MNGNKKPTKVSGDASVVSWVLTALLLAIEPFPLGLFFLIAKLSGHDFLGRLFMALQEGFRSAGSSDGARSSTNRTGQSYTPNSSSRSRAARAGEGQTAESGESGQRPSAPLEANRVKVVQQAPQPTQNVQTAKPGDTEKAAGEKKAAAGEKEKKDDGIQHISRGKKALFYCGWVLLAGGIFLGIHSIAGGAALWRVLQWIAVALGGGGMLFTAHTKDKKERLYQNMVKIVGDKACIDIKSLASAAGVKEKNLLRELDEMMERGYFPASAYIDNAKNLLVMDPDKALDYSGSAAAETPQELGREEDKYDLLIKEMERACGRIRDRDMLEKSVQVRGLAAAIFDAARRDPEKQPQISSFLNYYFPTTLKLLDSYADFEEKGYQGEKLSQTKERIETTMDTIIAAYRKQLDNLYLHDTLDVDTDIDVLETMLKRDGLSDSDFSQGDQQGTPGVM